VFGCFVTSLAALAVGAGAAGAALAAAVLLAGGDLLEVALLGFNYDDAIAGTFLHALALVSTVAVAALVRHGRRFN
jgi:ABC-type uncharacterized transport system permease subunit